jgi:maleate cis-trans isomerase
MADIDPDAETRATEAEIEINASPLLRVLRSYDPYGWLARIGLITPSTNTVTAPEWQLMAPEGVSIHVARATLFGATSQSSYEAMGRSTEQAAIDLSTAEVDIVSYCCTSGTFVCDRREIAARADCPANCATDAVVAALKAQGVRKVALATPYVDFVNEAEVRMLEEEGFEIVSVLGLGLGKTQAERRAMNRIPHETVVNMARRVNCEEAEGILLSCAALSGIQLLNQMESMLGKPVITTNQATFWLTMRMLGLNEPIFGFGSLLSAQ